MSIKHLGRMFFFINKWSCNMQCLNVCLMCMVQSKQPEIQTKIKIIICGFPAVSLPHVRTRLPSWMHWADDTEVQVIGPDCISNNYMKLTDYLRKLFCTETLRSESQTLPGCAFTVSASTLWDRLWFEKKPLVCTGICMVFWLFKYF